jgi:hypothetical protein
MHSGDDDGDHGGSVPTFYHGLANMRDVEADHQDPRLLTTQFASEDQVSTPFKGPCPRLFENFEHVV